MRVVLDTNILVSAVISPVGNPAAIYLAWSAGRFVLLTCAEHTAELRRILCEPRISVMTEPHKAGRVLNQIREFAEHISRLPRVERSLDPGDDFLLALAEAGKADYLVTGDKAGLLSLRTHKTTRIVSASQFARLFAPSRKRHLHQRGIKPER